MLRMSEAPSNPEERLDRVVTQWSLLRLAHETASMETAQARQRLLLKYNRAIRSYVGALLQNDEDADEVAQDVLMRLLRGDFASADPKKGRFRDFLKVAVKNMVRKHWSGKQRRAGVNLDVAQVAAAQANDPIDAAWDRQWQKSVLDCALRALENFERANPGCVYATLLKLRAEHADADSPQLAELLSYATGKAWKPDATRQQLRRGRLRLAQLLVEEIAGSMNSPSADLIEAELIDLGLMEYVRPFLPSDWREHGELRDSIA